MNILNLLLWGVDCGLLCALNRASWKLPTPLFIVLMGDATAILWAGGCFMDPRPVIGAIDALGRIGG